MARKISEVFVEVSARTDKMRSEIGRAEKRVGRFADKTRDHMRTIRRVFAVVLAGLAIRSLKRFTQETIDAVDVQEKFAQRLGVSANALRGLSFAGEIAGVPTAQLTIGLQRMTRRVSEAARGMGEAQDALKELGLDAKKLNKLGVDDQFLSISNAVGQFTNRADQVRLFFKLFDSEGVGLLQLADAGSQKIQDLIKRAEELGLTLDTRQTKAIIRAKDAATELGTAWEGLKRQILSLVAGPLAASMERTTNLIAAVIAKIREHGDAIRATFSAAFSIVRRAGQAALGLLTKLTDKLREFLGLKAGEFNIIDEITIAFKSLFMFLRDEFRILRMRIRKLFLQVQGPFRTEEEDKELKDLKFILGDIKTTRDIDRHLRRRELSAFKRELQRRREAGAPSATDTRRILPVEPGLQASAGQAAREIARNFTRSVQTAIGQFKTGQARTAHQRALEKNTSTTNTLLQRILDAGPGTAFT